MIQRRRVASLAVALLTGVVMACGGESGDPGMGTRDDSSSGEPSSRGPFRSSQPWVRAQASATPTPILDEDLPDGGLPRGEKWTREVRLHRTARYRLQLSYEGEAPALWFGSTDDAELRPVQIISSTPGLIEAQLTCDTPRGLLELRAFRGAITTGHVTLRRYGSSSVRGTSSAPGELGLVKLGYDTRPGYRIPRDRPLRLPLRLPDHATQLALAVAPDPAGKGDAGSLRVSWASEGEPESVLLTAHVGAATTALGERFMAVPWVESLVDVRALAGQDGELVVEADAPGPQATAVFAVPEILCETGRRRPNLIVISIDTLRPDRLGVHGYERDTSPQLQRLADQGVVFERALSVSSYTLPSHTTMFSGMHPLGHGVAHPSHAIDAQHVPLLAELLRDQGYATRAFTGGGYLSADYGFSRGFSVYSEFDPTRPTMAAEQAWLDANIGFTAGFSATRNALGWKAALRWIEQRRDVPFFVFLQTFAVHDYRPAEQDRERFGAPADGMGVQPLRAHGRQLETPYDDDELAELSDLYDGAIASVDRRVGELLDTLEALQLTNDTIVVVTSDHGESIGEHGNDQNHVGHAFGLWHEQVAIPWILVAPGLKAQRRDELVTLVDVTPTLLDLLDLPVDPRMQGVSLRPLLDGHADAPVPSPALLDLHSSQSRVRALYARGFKLIVADPTARVTMPVDFEQALYVRETDPGELHDHATDRPDIADRMRAELEALVALFESGGPGAAGMADLSEETLQALAELGYVDR